MLQKYSGSHSKFIIINIHKRRKEIPANLVNEIKSVEEEWADMVSHGVGIIIFAIAGPVLIYRSWTAGHSWLFYGSIIFWITLLMVYTSSTLYHSSYNLKQRRRYRTLDHICIYFLIAGSYTPIILYYFRDTRGWLILGTLWGMTLLGSIFKLFYTHKFKKLSTAVYLLMGWLAILIINPILETLPVDAITCIVIGGASYTIGVVFYLWSKLYMNHFIWHLFVLGGSMSHFLAVYFCI